MWNNDIKIRQKYKKIIIYKKKQYKIIKIIIYKIMSYKNNNVQEIIIYNK